MKTLFSGSEAKPREAVEPEKQPVATEETKMEEPKTPEAAPSMIQPPSMRDDMDEEDKVAAPVVRRVLQAPVIETGLFEEGTDKILIKAQAAANGEHCLFRVNRDLFKGHSWWFPNFEAAAGSPIAERMFSIDGVETVLVHESTVTLTRTDKTLVDWKAMATEVGQTLRELLEEGGPLISDKIISEMLTEEQIRTGIQKAIDVEVNPGVAGHGGNVTLLAVKGNTVTIQMGGGCQGCSAADITLKQGIHTTFRTHVPQVGAIYDETDHAAGLNPFF
ncbi:MAG: hypothetical protein G3M78_10310 [Candidatus Nitrohelix vancouverensis]|uniref:Scaffold protein Nfu/NifU N-terminal domain-containing protein n=1 Tax=Candidatus Nitrohelix vancouverensis TaxID=2705534 RepID=A0A7T0C5E2_9BACT|nr:MAG: hypothetical protein G3M78_10310 [Candidatus Nitrohelix vancouverensis]